MQETQQPKMSTYSIKNGYHADKDRYVIEIKNTDKNNNNSSEAIAYFSEDSYRDFANNMIRLISTTTKNKGVS